MNNHLVEVSPDSPIEQKDRINYTQLNSQIAFLNIGEGSQPEISLQDDDYTSDQIESLIKRFSERLRKYRE
ncbi:unnamed protein product [Moneuplotes crassus]|uniref:Uncharacterized protein n=1 Tax=Euplotes crassus TaxID=5936 RepID=A0AAD1XN98_EUPCR|nr:unnamed protein product [Moneuplotes crassus]